jgi:hypothetical protein
MFVTLVIVLRLAKLKEVARSPGYNIVAAAYKIPVAHLHAGQDVRQGRSYGFLLAYV